MDMLLGRERIQRSKVIMQPDVVMLVYLLWERMPPEVRRANFEYYEPRCGHGSSLSPAIHALVAARLGDTRLAERYFRQAAEIDLVDNMGNAARGVHVGALGGLWQAAVFGFAGLRLYGERPELCSNLPLSWRSLSMRLQWRGRSYEIVIALVPPERGTMSWHLHHVSIPHDGTPSTSTALRPAAEIAERGHAELLRYQPHRFADRAWLSHHATLC
jgi:trehalose/maltose hydrolase-like predicted phosphorylase